MILIKKRDIRPLKMYSNPQLSKKMPEPAKSGLFTPEGQ
jgi:hypothetical protein